jgi:hypothetical protein
MPEDKRPENRPEDKRLGNRPEDKSEDTPRPIEGQVLSRDEALLRRLEHIVSQLDEYGEEYEEEEEEEAASRAIVPVRDDFSLASSEPEDREPDPQEVLVEIQDRLQESGSEEFGRAIMALIGGALGSHLGGPTGAGIGAALSQLLYNGPKKNNPLKDLLG